MSELVFFLEECSAEALLSTMLPRLAPRVRHRCIVFEGKQDLEKRIVRRMSGYLVPGARFVVLRDQDAANCITIKANLKQKCKDARHPDAVVRIACHELESWYLADLLAVERGLGKRGLQQLQNRQKYRSPDETINPSRTLAQIAPGYQKIGGSRAIGTHLDLDNKRSSSFAHFISAIRRLAGELQKSKQK